MTKKCTAKNGQEETNPEYETWVRANAHSTLEDKFYCTLSNIKCRDAYWILSSSKVVLLYKQL